MRALVIRVGSGVGVLMSALALVSRSDGLKMGLSLSLGERELELVWPWSMRQADAHCCMKTIRAWASARQCDSFMPIP